jgi:hypothetical protein
LNDLGEWLRSLPSPVKETGMLQVTFKVKDVKGNFREITKAGDNPWRTLIKDLEKGFLGSDGKRLKLKNVVSIQLVTTRPIKEL